MKISKNSKLINTIRIALILLVLTSSTFALPSDPDNAALLYYQSYILYGKPDDTMQDMLYDLSEGKIEPNAKIREYVESCRNAIDLAVAAAEIQNCNWGLKYSDGLSVQMPHLAQGRYLSRLVLADARILAAGGDYKQAIDRYLSVRKITRHIGDETLVSLLVAAAISNMANECIQDILAEIPQDLETLSWLKNQLVAVSSGAPSFKAALKGEQRWILTDMTKAMADVIAEAIAPAIGHTVIERVRAADEEFFERNRDYFKNYISSLQTILHAAMTYAKTYEELKKLSEKPQKDTIEDTGATLTVVTAPALFKVYGHEMRNKTFSNAIEAAVDIYIIKVKTGRFPNTLPADLPKDLFSGKDFGYKKTDDGFILRCQGKDLNKNKIHQYEFKIKK